MAVRILVTGGQGFVGARLARQLSDDGHQVRVASRSGRGSLAWLPQAQAVQMRWDDIASLDAACAGCELVIHAAGMNAQDCAADPAGALQFNGVATAMLAQSAVRSGVRRMVYLSTAHVYGSPLVGRFDEQSCPRNLHPYASSHLAGEMAVLHAASRGAMDATVVRLSNACGAPVTAQANCWMLLFNDLCREAVAHGRLTLRTDPRQQRDFIPMADAVRAIAWLAQLPAGQAQGIVNVGAGRGCTLLDIAHLIAAGAQRVLGYEPQLHLPSVSGDEPAPLEYRIDRLLATGYVPRPSMDAEVDATLAFCRAQEARAS